MRNPLLALDNGRKGGLLLWGESTDEDSYLWRLSVTSTELIPEKRLMVALIEDAIHCFQLNKPGKLTEDALKWIESRETEYLFSFENCCTTLGLAADCVRRQIQWEIKRLSTAYDKAS